MSFFQMPSPLAARRLFLGRTGLTLSGTAVALLAGNEVLATQAGTIRHETPIALAIRQETQILHANRERTRPPRELAWALAMYLYSLAPPPSPTVATTDAVTRGRAIFDRDCTSCHSDPDGAGPAIAAIDVGTDPALALGTSRGTGLYRPAPLTRVADAAPYLHHGVVATLEDMFDPARLQPGYTRGAHGPGPIPGHLPGTELPATSRDDLIATNAGADRFQNLLSRNTQFL